MVKEPKMLIAKEPDVIFFFPRLKIFLANMVTALIKAIKKNGKSSPGPAKFVGNN